MTWVKPDMKGLHPVTPDRLRSWLRELRELCPPIVPVRVRRRSVSGGVLGYCTLRRDDSGHPSHFLIVLEANMSRDATVHVLMHEWAHALAWSEGHDTVCDHDPEWGLAYSRVYQEFMSP